MPAALVVEVAVRNPEDCPVAAASFRTGEPATAVSRTSAGDRVTEEFSLPADASLEESAVGDPMSDESTGDDSAGVDPMDEDPMNGDFAVESSPVGDQAVDGRSDGNAGPDAVSPVAVATVDDRTRYRFTRERGRACACEVVEQVAGPASTIRARNGTLSVSFLCRDRETVRDAVGALRDGYDEVRLRRLVQVDSASASGSASGSGSGPDSGSGSGSQSSPVPGSESSPVVVDRGALTARQREVLETAHDLGFFDYPRTANTTEVADALDISTSTVREHLAAAQRSLLDAVLK